MASYSVPQVEVHQIFSEVPAALSQNQVAFVFGPNYLLHRYSESSEKANTYIDTYEGTTGLFGEYPNAVDPENVDTSYTKLFGDEVWVKLGDFSTVAVGADNKDELTITYVSSTTPELAEVYAGRVFRLTVDANPVDVTILSVEAGETEDTLKVTIDEEITGSTVTAATLCEIQNGVEFPREDFTDTDKAGFFWTEAENSDGEPGIKISRALQAYYADSDYTDKTENYGEVLHAKLYLTYRELVTTYSDTIHSLTNASEVATFLGAVSPDNPLSQAVYNTALNAGGQTVRYMAVPTDDEDGFDAVLNKATLTNEVYFLVPVTRDSSVIQNVKAHCESMSEAKTKRWRIAFVSEEIPDEYAVYSSANRTNGKDFEAKCTKIDGAGKKKTATVQFGTWDDTTFTASTETSFKKDLVVGDVLCYNYHTEWGKTVPCKFTVKKILSPNSVLVSDPNNVLVANDQYNNAKAEIYHVYTNAEKAEKIGDISSALGSHRVYNVFPSVFTTDGVQMTGEFAAACVAGLVSSCLPQQPVTNMQLTGIDEIPLVYQTFSLDQLNTMAAGGTFIVMQDLPSDDVYVRHQLSTAYEDNNLNLSELSITKNLDSISYYFDNLMSPYIGKYNITPELLMVLRNVVNSGLTSLEASTGLYGPQLIAEGTEIATLAQDELLKDHVNCSLQLNMPYPFNHLILNLYV